MAGVGAVSLVSLLDEFQRDFFANYVFPPELAHLRWGVPIYFQDPLPFDWFKSSKSGITLGHEIHMRSQYLDLIRTGDPGAMELLIHELIHIGQFAGSGVFWWAKYLIHHKKLEAQAYQMAREIRALWEAKLPEYQAWIAWKKGRFPL